MFAGARELAEKALRSLQSGIAYSNVLKSVGEALETRQVGGWWPTWGACLLATAKRRFQEISRSGQAAATMSANDQTERFGQLVNTKAELFASSSSTTKQHDERQRMQEEALGVVRSLTNAHLASEKETLPLFSAMLEHVNGSRPVTRSKQKQKQAEEQEKGPGKVEGTPLSEVYVPKGGDVDGIVWEQLEMRLKTVQQVLSSLLGHSQSKPSQEESDQDQDSDEAAMDQDAQEEEEEEDSQDDVSEDGAQEMDQDDLEEIDEDESDASSLDEPEQVEPLNGNPEQQPSNKQSRRKGPTSPVDDQFFSLHDFLQQSEQGEAQMARQISEAQKEPQGESDDDDDEDEPEEDVDLFAQVPEEDEEEDVQDLGDAAGLSLCLSLHYSIRI